jgi:hypothetical protein
MSRRKDNSDILKPRQASKHSEALYIPSQATPTSTPLNPKGAENTERDPKVQPYNDFL